MFVLKFYNLILFHFKTKVLSCLMELYDIFAPIPISAFLSCPRFFYVIVYQNGISVVILSWKLIMEGCIMILFIVFDFEIICWSFYFLKVLANNWAISINPKISNLPSYINEALIFFVHFVSFYSSIQYIVTFLPAIEFQFRQYKIGLDSFTMIRWTVINNWNK